MSENLYLYLTGRHAYLRRRVGYFGRGKIEDAGNWAWESADELSSRFLLESENDRFRGRKLHVLIGSALCKLLVADLPSGVRDTECEAVATAQMVHQLGVNPEEWEVSWEAELHTKKLFVCCLRRSMVECIKALASESGLKLLSLKPFAASVWNHFAGNVSAQSTASLIAVEDDALAIFTCESGVLQAIGTFYHQQEPEIINREVNRLQMTSVGEHDVRIAAPSHFRHLMISNMDRVVRKPQKRQGLLMEEFCDLVMTGEESTIRDEEVKS